MDEGERDCLAGRYSAHRLSIARSRCPRSSCGFSSRRWLLPLRREDRASSSTTAAAGLRLSLVHWLVDGQPCWRKDALGRADARGRQRGKRAMSLALMMAGLRTTMLMTTMRERLWSRTQIRVMSME